MGDVPILGTPLGVIVIRAIVFGGAISRSQHFWKLPCGGFQTLRLAFCGSVH